MPQRPICLIIRDGWGKGKEDETNAIFIARTPYTDQFEKEYPTTTLKAHGLDVGLPEGNQGNSEVGHLNIGAGRIVYQSLTRIDKAIKEGDFFTNKVFLDAIGKAKANNSTLHLMGLVQEEGVHAVTRHCLALLELCTRNNFNNVLVHAFLDGRDTPPKSAYKHLTFLQEGIDRLGCGRIASLIGRYYAMDRDKRWDRIKLAYDALRSGKGEIVANWEEGINDAYAAGETDEFVKPRLINYGGMATNDVVIFFNFRLDRTRQLTKAFVEPDFNEFETCAHAIHFVGMTHYYDDGHFIEAFPPLENKNILGEVISRAGLTQLRCAETEKYAHVTFFFNNQINDPFPHQDNILVNSPKVATYDLQPEMSAYIVRDRLVEAINADKYDVIICNFANGDMVGHTGVFKAAVKAAEVVDECVHDVLSALQRRDGIALVTADHGNAEQMLLADGSPMTAHTCNDVPFSLIGAGDVTLRDDGRLCDIAPTILVLLGIKQPQEMTGKSLII
ncbi:MAG: 2,3-bisphosphoglycerate-independent phosphoglycerate mutase [bacterium]